ncbi:hypothetical protein D3C72_1724220 [compost metagenome]
MKKTDIAMIILIASMSVLVAYFIAGALPMFKTNEKPVKVKTVDVIKTDVIEPDPAIFNKEAINPTVEVLIGGGTNATQ